MEHLHKSRELVGFLIGTFTILIFLSPKFIFILFLTLLSFFISYEISKAIDVKGFFFLSHFITLLASYDKGLGIVALLLFTLLQGWKFWSLDVFNKSLLIFLYAGFLPSFLWDLKDLGNLYLLELLFFVWVVDVSAYYVGKNFGKTKIAKRISPHKTWEGFIGSLIFGSLYSVFVFKNLAFGPILVIFAFYGDLFKSFIKRQVGIKDFSNFLGSHGGFVDRFDSLILCAPVYFYLLTNS